MNEWIGDENSGQLGYYKRQVRGRTERARVTKRIAILGVCATFAALAALLAVGAGIPHDLRSPIVYAMACVLLLVGVRQSYAKSTAESELIKQYEFMHRIFRNARRRLDVADNDGDRRRILRMLGDAALEEHAEWILMYRERSIDEKDAVRLG